MNSHEDQIAAVVAKKWRTAAIEDFRAQVANGIPSNIAAAHAIKAWTGRVKFDVDSPTWDQVQ